MILVQYAAVGFVMSDAGIDGDAPVHAMGTGQSSATCPLDRCTGRDLAGIYPDKAGGVPEFDLPDPFDTADIIRSACSNILQMRVVCPPLYYFSLPAYLGLLALLPAASASGSS